MYDPIFKVSKATDLRAEMHFQLVSYCVISIFVTSIFCHFNAVASDCFFFPQNPKTVLQLLKSDYSTYKDSHADWTLMEGRRKRTIYDTLEILGIQISQM